MVEARDIVGVFNVAIESAILTEITTASKHPMPESIKRTGTLVRLICKTADKSFWNGLSAPATEYLKQAIKSNKTGTPIPMPEDFREIESPGKSKKPKPESDDANAFFLNLDYFECQKTTKLITIRGLLEMKEAGVVRVPDFQRKYIWSAQIQKLFLKGVLRGMPILSITLAVDDKTNERFLLDGVQRTETLSRFFNDQIVVDRKKFSALPDKLRNDFLMSEIVIAECRVAKIHWPEIFQFINQSGVPLAPIEIWRAIFRHDLLTNLESVSTDHALWAEVYGRNNDKRYKGMYLLLRAVAMDCCYREYQKPMNKFLINFCNELGLRPDMVDAAQIHSDLDRILFGIRNHGRAIFRTSPGGQVNMGMLDCILHAGFEAIRLVPECSATQIHDWLEKVAAGLLAEQPVLNALSLDTSGNEHVLLRMRRSEELIREIIETS